MKDLKWSSEVYDIMMKAFSDGLHYRVNKVSRISEQIAYLISVQEAERGMSLSKPSYSTIRRQYKKFLENCKTFKIETLPPAPILIRHICNGKIKVFKIFYEHPDLFNHNREVVEVNIDPNDLSSVWIKFRKGESRIKVYATDQKYSRGLSLNRHKKNLIAIQSVRKSKNVKDSRTNSQ